MQDFTKGKLNWEDLRLILAASRGGSFARAAVELGVSTPTVFRHAKEMEERLGARVFRRDNRGVSLTAAGRDAAALAQTIEVGIADLEARLANRDVETAGTIRLATVDTLVAGPLMPILARFRKNYSAIVVDLRTGTAFADIRSRETDAALRAGGEPSEMLVGRKLCRIAVAIYRPVGTKGRADLTSKQAAWVVPNEQLKHLASFQWLHEQGFAERAALQVGSLHSLAEAVAAGMGYGILPCYLADLDERLQRVGNPIDRLTSDLWFLTHAEMRHSGRIRALSDYLAQEFRALRPLFEGKTKSGI